MFDASLPSVCLVIPAKNEARNIHSVLARVPDFIQELILVDGHSDDGTVDIAVSIRPDIKVVTDDRPGKGSALRVGFNEAESDFVVIIDADGSMDPQEVIRYVGHMASGYELVKGSRFMVGAGSSDITVIRHLGNKALVTLTNLLFKQRFTDLCYGYLAFDRRRFAELGLRSTGFEIEAEIVTKAAMNGLRITEVPTFESPRLHGVSNLNAIRDGFRILFTILRERGSGRRVRPPRQPAEYVVDLRHDGHRQPAPLPAES
ncbi:MAG: glycosyltransferase family 2 protein [Acidimicrobiia bacterium]|nr:glycosyltransferase family 2 protein [Acidimicrobiia bacterium]